MAKAKSAILKDKLYKAAERALLAVMEDEKLADSMPSSIGEKIDDWYKLHVDAEHAAKG